MSGRQYAAKKFFTSKIFMRNAAPFGASLKRTPVPRPIAIKKSLAAYCLNAFNYLVVDQVWEGCGKDGLLCTLYPHGGGEMS